MDTIKYEKLNAKSNPIYFEQIAKLHQEEISKGFLTTLGTKFLVKIYKNITDSENAFMYIAIHEKRVIGFIACSVSTGRFYKDFILREAFSILPILFPKMLSLSFFKKIIETLLYPTRNDRNIEMPKSEILNFCVTNSVQRMGVGQNLFKQAIEEFKNFNIYTIKIITGLSQTKAQGFYESSGAIKVKEIEVHKDITSVVYLYYIIQ